MPIYKIITPQLGTRIVIWKITESTKELLNNLNLSNVHLQRVKGMKSDIHKRGFLSVRHLIKHFGYHENDLYHDTNGKPHLKDGKHISITHSFNFSAIIISNNPVGIDIEKQREKITLIAKKFVDYESQYLNKKSEYYTEMLTCIWCIKESMYKRYSIPGLSFKKHLLVIPFNPKDHSTRAWIDFKDIKQSCDTYILAFEGFSCAYIF